MPPANRLDDSGVGNASAFRPMSQNLRDYVKTLYTQDKLIAYSGRKP